MLTKGRAKPARCVAYLTICDRVGKEATVCDCDQAVLDLHIQFQVWHISVVVRSHAQK